MNNKEINYKFIPTPTIFEDILSLRTHNILNTLLNLQRMYGKANKLTIDGYFYLPFEELQRRTQTKTKAALYPKLDTLFLHDLLSIKSVGQSKGKKVNYYRVKTENFKRYDNIKYDEIHNFIIKDRKSERGYKVKYTSPNCKKLVPMELLQREQAQKAMAQQQIIKGEIIPITANILQKTKVSIYGTNCTIPFARYIRDCTLQDFISEGKSKREFIEMARKYKAEGNEEAYKRIKQGLNAATISATFPHNRKSDNPNCKPNHILCLDIDGHEQTLDTETIASILGAKGYIFYIAKSLSGNGLWALVEYEPNRAIEDVFYTIKTELQQEGIILDGHCKDMARLRIQSYDDNAYFNPNAIKYTNSLNKAYKESEQTTPSKRTDNAKNAAKRGKNNTPIIADSEQVEYMEKLAEYCTANHITITENHDETLFVSRTLAATFGEIGKGWLVTIHKEQDYINGEYIQDDSDEVSRLYDNDLQKFAPSNQFEAIQKHVNAHGITYINGNFQREYRQAI